MFVSLIMCFGNLNSHVTGSKTEDNIFVSEMDQHVKRMLKLIEEDAESFAKKAEIYFRKRPELISLVEEFYRMYRSLAERYDHVTGELRKNIPTDLQSQGSAVSDVSSDLPTTWPSPDQQRLSRKKSGPRAAGFDFFLGSGGNGTESTKEGDESSTLDSESESDDSSVNNYVGTQSSDEDQGLRKRIVELEDELRDVKDKFRMLQEEISEGSYGGGSRTGDSEALLTRIAGYEEELKVAREKIKLSEEEINKLKDELHKYKFMESSSNVNGVLEVIRESSYADEASMKQKGTLDFEENTGDSQVIEDQEESKIHALAEELKITKVKLVDSEKEVERLRSELQGNGSSINRLQEQLGTSQKEISVWKSKLERERREVSKLQDRIVRYKSNLSERDQEIRALRETISNANKTLSEENSQLQAEITRLVKEKTYLDDNIKEMDLRCQSLEEDVRRIKAGKTEMEALLGAEIETLKAGIEEKNANIEQLNRYVDELRLRYDTLMAEKDKLDAKVDKYCREISSKDAHMDEMKEHLHQLHLEHVELIAGAEGARKQVEELKSRVRELEVEVERQNEVILEGAEEKREAIRQLCVSIEHYRDGYHQLRQAFIGGHKQRLPVMAS